MMISSSKALMSPCCLLRWQPNGPWNTSSAYCAILQNADFAVRQ